MARKLLRNFIEKYIEDHESFTTDNVVQAYNEDYRNGTTPASVIYILSGLKRVGQLRLKKRHTKRVVCS